MSRRLASVVSHRCMSVLIRMCIMDMPREYTRSSATAHKMTLKRLGDRVREFVVAAKSGVDERANGEIRDYLLGRRNGAAKAVREFEAAAGKAALERLIAAHVRVPGMANTGFLQLPLYGEPAAAKQQTFRFSDATGEVREHSARETLVIDLLAGGRADHAVVAAADLATSRVRWQRACGEDLRRRCRLAGLDPRKVSVAEASRLAAPNLVGAE